MTQPSGSQRVSDYLVELYGGDPFAHVREASDSHREAHGPECGVYPSGPIKMRFLATVTRAANGRRILEIGCGLGYSALWLAEAAGLEGRVETIDRFPEHARLAEDYASAAQLASRITVIVGEGSDVLQTLTGPYDLIHDDGWFAEEPPYFERMVNLLRAGGLLLMSNWFLLEDAITGEAQMDWSQFAGPHWAEHIQDYAHTLTSRPDLHVSFVQNPWVALAMKLA